MRNDNSDVRVVSLLVILPIQTRIGQRPGAWEGHANAGVRLCTAEAFMMLRRHLEMHKGTPAGNKR
jgi:hypothetical protein